MPMLLFFVRWKLWCFDIYRSSVGICPSSFALLQAEPKGIGERLGRVVEVVCSCQALVPMPGRINRRAKAMHWKKQGKRLAGGRCLFFFLSRLFSKFVRGNYYTTYVYIHICIYRHILCIYIDIYCVYIYIYIDMCVLIYVYIYMYMYTVQTMFITFVLRLLHAQGSFFLDGKAAKLQRAWPD